MLEVVQLGLRRLPWGVGYRGEKHRIASIVFHDPLRIARLHVGIPTVEQGGDLGLVDRLAGLFVRQGRNRGKGK